MPNTVAPGLQHRVEHFAARIGVIPPTVQVRDLGYRWGSCGRGVNLDWRSILLPPRYIDYILAHELVRLCEPRHNKHFWAALSSVAHVRGTFRLPAGEHPPG